MGGLISIDPGKHQTGWAWFEHVDNRLGACGLSPTKRPTDLLDVVRRVKPDLVIFEKPQIYDARLQKGDPNDLVDLTFVGGVLAGRVFEIATCGPCVESIRPREWKGQRPKKVDNEYTVELLNQNERDILDACGVSPSKKHNVIDAIGIGLWRLNRR